MKLSKKKVMVFGLGCGILLFFFGLGLYILLGPSSTTNQLPRQVSSAVKLSGMGLICICLLVGALFAEGIDSDTKTLMLIFGIIILLVNIFILSYVR